ncbi:MAG: hypothetical protein RLZZ602_1587 [Pseudomonadota bacterium]|jgi:hypothetical protein
MVKFFGLILIPFLYGCETVRYVDRVVEVEVPVIVPCEVDMPPLYPYYFYEMRPEMSAAEKFDLAVLSLKQYHQAEKELRELLSICIGEQNGPEEVSF